MGLTSDQTQKIGPPRPLPLAMVEQLFGEFATVELLNQEEEQDRDKMKRKLTLSKTDSSN